MVPKGKRLLDEKKTFFPDARRDDYQKRSGEKELPRNKFRIVSLHFPSDYTSSVLIDLMSEAKSFHMWFERDQNKKDQMKKGGLSLTFDDEESAKHMYHKVKNQKCNGMKLKIHASKSFDEEASVSNSPKQLFDVKVLENVDPLLHQKLFVSQLLPTTDDDLIYAVFGKENLNHIDISLDERRKDGTKTAILTFLNRELAEQSKQDYDGFVVDDGELSKPMKIILYLDYLQRKESDKHYRLFKGAKKFKNDEEVSNDNSVEITVPIEEILDFNSADGSAISTEASILHCDDRGKAGNLWSAQIAESRYPDSINELQKTETAPKTTEGIAPDAPPSHWNEMKNDDSFEADATEQPQYSGELSIAELQHWVNTTVERDRINWGELNTIEELWTIVNNVVKETGWQPEEALKEAMLQSLEVAKASQPNVEWWQNHMKFLIKIWKKEVELETRSKTRVKLQLAMEPTELEVKPVSDYLPPPHSPKAKRKSGKKALMELMGVGALLANFQKEAAEENEKQKTAHSNEQDSATVSKPKQAKKAKQIKRRRRRSSCESGEASSTTSEGEDSEALSECESTNYDEKRRHEKRKKKVERHQTHSSKTAELAVKNTATVAMESEQRPVGYVADASANTTAPMNLGQNWMAQFMPTFMQMMPMMMQMCQMRMMSMTTMSPQQQQQMTQFQQQMTQMFSQLRTGQNQPSFPNPMNVMQFFQRMPSMNVQTNGASYAPTQQGTSYDSASQNPRYGYPGYPNY